MHPCLSGYASRVHACLSEQQQATLDSVIVIYDFHYKFQSISENIGIFKGSLKLVGSHQKFCVHQLTQSYTGAWADGP